ncbi:hypothetical protein ACETPF_20530 [Sphingobium sp. sgz301304]|uniref:hypothetical protein n=1 Tax=Sphingobium sp. sgz301304 TaxID=3341828 RepID=UPI0035A71628
MALEIYHLRAIGGRGDELLEAHERYGYFAEAVDDDLHRRGGPPVPCLMTFISGKITHSGTLYAGNKAAEGQKRVNISKVGGLRPPIRAGEIVDAVDPMFRATVRDQLRKSCMISGSAAEALLEAIREIDPALAMEIDRFEIERARVSSLPSNKREALALEKEMVGTALSFAGIDRREMQDWTMPNDDGASFLDGLPQARLREDAMVMHDMSQVPGFEYVRPVAKSAAYFQSGDVRLTVVLANHLAIEEQLGADLLYFNETYRAFTLIQYKAMERGDMSTAIFRLPNPKLSEEIERMRRLQASLRDAPPNSHCEGFRLIENPFYLKLCPRMEFEPADTGLVKGMYLPLDYWLLIEADRRKVGPRGGRLVSFENVGRYFDNTSFIPLVANGWVGTTAEQSAILGPIVKDLVSSGRSLTMAVSRSRKKPPPQPGFVHDRSHDEERQHVRIYRG